MDRRRAFWLLAAWSLSAAAQAQLAPGLPPAPAAPADPPGLRPGDVAVVQAAKYVQGRGLQPDGPPTRLTVVGLYEVSDPAEAYWAGQRYFPVQADGTRHEAVFGTPQTLDLIGHTLGQSSIDALASRRSTAALAIALRR